MTIKNFLKHLTIIVFCIYSLTVFGQSFSGNVQSYSSEDLGYANVNIYKDGKLVANVLTDINGDFKVKLDTGSYHCEIVYAGYKKITKEIVVRKDEKNDFNMTIDEESKYVGVLSLSSTKRHSRALRYRMEDSEETEIDMDKESRVVYSIDDDLEYIEDEISEPKRRYDKPDKNISISNMWGGKPKEDSVGFGKLTAGEINDFSKWELWNDLSNGELKTIQDSWNFAPTKRYTVQLKDKINLPIANAKIEIISDGKVVYTSRTDNTGKAELWGNLKPDTIKNDKDISIKINFNGETKIINNVKKIDDGINTIIFDTEYEQTQDVDIAIVVDATGSMQDEIDYLKFDLNDVIYKSKAFSSTLNFRFANIFYRDRGDAYLVKKQDFTNILSESTAYTNQNSARGGGDFPEAVEAALDTAINKLNWNKNTRTKILFLVLDAPPHNTPRIREKMIELASQAAEKGIRIVPITGSGIDKSTEYLMRCLALATNGTYTFLNNYSSIGNSHIEPSTDNYKVEILNNLLVRIIKSYTYMPDKKQQIADLGVNLPDSFVIIKNNIDSLDIENKNPTEPNNLKDSVELKWKFYPNPTTGIINIVSNKYIKELYISDLSGKALKIIKNISSDEIVRADISQYASGIYLIRYPLGKQWISGKIMLVHN